MRRLSALIIVLASIFLPWVTATAQSAGDVTASLSLTEVEPTVGDLLHLTLEVHHPAGWQVIVPQSRQAWQGSPFEVREQSIPEVISNGDGSQTTRVTITAVLYAPGKFQTPAWAFTVNPSSGAPFEQPIPSATVEIKSVLKGGEQNLRDLKPQAALPTPPLWLLIAAGLLIIATIAGLIWWYISRRRSRKSLATSTAALDTRPPWQAALDELSRIEGLCLLETAGFKQFYSLTTDCLRLFLERQFNVAALDRTTAEIKHSLRRSTLAPAQTSVLLDLLTEADLVKFAKFIPDAAAAQNVMGRARAFVEEVKPDVPAL